MNKILKKVLVFFVVVNSIFCTGQIAYGDTSKEKDNVNDSLVYSTKDGNAYDYNENQAVDTTIDDGYASLRSFDLRHVGGTVSYDEEAKKNVITGGLSYVTPVKLQNPWGTCWAFGITAATETSILYELGLGTETVDNNLLDLSERHLAWFAKNAIPETNENGEAIDVDEQNGEGEHYFDDVEGETMEGGWTFFGTYAYAAGVGPATEESFPYQGKNLMVEARRKKSADASIYSEKYLYYDSVDDWLAESDSGIKENYYLFSYSDEDDWSISEDDRFTQTYPLEESNILPSFAGIMNDDGTISLDEDGIVTVKSELYAGKAVSMAFLADSSKPNGNSSVNVSRYINDNYAHFVWDSTNVNHAVCIVGWDDDYDASNFGQDNPVLYDDSLRVVYKLKDSDQILSYDEDDEDHLKLYYESKDGVRHDYTVYSEEIEAVIDSESASSTVPPGNGAWIVKNSWGATTNDFPNYDDWGVDGSGYFYISYYDTSLCAAETYDFVTSADEQEDYEYSLVFEYDFMVTGDANGECFDIPVSTANVFEVPEDTEINSLSCQTTTPGTTVTYDLYILDEDQEFAEPDIEEPVTSATATYRYGGYHKIILDEPILVKEGQKFSVVVTQSFPNTDGTTTYCTSFNYGEDEEYAKENGYDSYYVGVVNPGESYFYYEDEGELYVEDLTDYTAELAADEYWEGITFDNYNIKAYGRPYSEVVETEQEATTTNSKLPIIIVIGVILLGVVVIVIIKKNKKKD